MICVGDCLPGHVCREGSVGVWDIAIVVFNVVATEAE
jgi:hypothetical protein